MAVYTQPAEDELAAWLAARSVGTLVSIEGIQGGIENSNFFVTTGDDGHRRTFVLTLFERMGEVELTYDLALMKHLASRDIPCPDPVPDRAGALYSTLAGKPATLVTRLSGRSILAPTAAHCAAMGGTLAAMHAAAADFAGRLDNPRGAAWWRDTAARVRVFLHDDQRALLDATIAGVAARWDETTGPLPRGAVHADLFRDNALFIERDAVEFGGVIDFYFAGDEAFVFDLAVCLNDWCIDLASGAFDDARVAAFLAGYEACRVLSDAERAALPAALCAAALRFWLSRLDDLHRPRPAQLLTPHDPTHFERILACRWNEASDRRH